MNNELTTALVGQIELEHKEADKHANRARIHVEEAVKHAFQCGAHIHDLDGMTKGHALAIVRDTLPNLPIKRAKAYQAIFATQSKRECLLPDHRQLLLLGIVAEHEQDGDPLADVAQVSADKWVGWVGKVRGWFDRVTQDKPLETWAEDEREALVAHLEPIVEIYQKAKL